MQSSRASFKSSNSQTHSPQQELPYSTRLPAEIIPECRSTYFQHEHGSLHKHLLLISIILKRSTILLAWYNPVNREMQSCKICVSMNTLLLSDLRLIMPIVFLSAIKYNFEQEATAIMKITTAVTFVLSLIPSSSLAFNVPSVSPSTIPSDYPSIAPSRLSINNSDLPSEIPTDTLSGMPSPVPSCTGKGKHGKGKHAKKVGNGSCKSTKSSSPTASSAPSKSPSLSFAPSVSSLPSVEPSISLSPSTSTIPSSVPSSCGKGGKGLKGACKSTKSYSPTASSTPSKSPSLSFVPSTSSLPSVEPSISLLPSTSTIPSETPSCGKGKGLSNGSSKGMKSSKKGCQYESPVVDHNGENDSVDPLSNAIEDQALSPKSAAAFLVLWTTTILLPLGTLFLF